MMDIERTLSVINQMVADGVIRDYALGGAIAAIYYVEPFETQDIDVFVQVKESGSDLMGLSTIYDYLLQRGCEAKAEHIYIEGFPVQFLPAYNQLTEEALTKAQTVQLGSLTTRVIRPEHLVAIMLKTGRTKDYLRINMFLQASAVDRELLNDVLQRHGLSEKWAANAYRFEP